MLTQTEAETLIADILKLSRTTRILAPTMVPGCDLPYRRDQLVRVADALDKISARLFNRCRHTWPFLPQLADPAADTTAPGTRPERIPPSPFVNLIAGQD